MVSRSTGVSGADSRNLQRDLDKIQQQWDKLRKEAVDRHTRLQTCMVSIYHIFHDYLWYFIKSYKDFEQISLKFYFYL